MIVDFIVKIPRSFSCCLESTPPGIAKKNDVCYLQRPPHLLSDAHETMGEDGQVHGVQLPLHPLAAAAAVAAVGGNALAAIGGDISDVDGHVSKRRNGGGAAGLDHHGRHVLDQDRGT